MKIWEAVWNDTVGEEKRFVQGLVQLATGYLKLSSGLYPGALKLLTRGCQTLRTCPPIYAGLQIGVLSDASNTVAHQLETGEDRSKHSASANPKLHHKKTCLWHLSTLCSRILNGHSVTFS